MVRRNTRPREIPGAFAVNGFPLVEFDRRPFDRYPLRGFALDWSAQLTLIQVVDCDLFRLDGYAVIRNSDVNRWRAIPKDDFVARAAALNKVRPSKPAALQIASMKEAISSAGAAFPLITIHRERIRKGVCYVGRLVRTSQRAVTILSITPQAEWEDEESYSLKDITLLEFGGAYESLLKALARK